MKNLIQKEIRLCFNFVNYIFLILSAMVMIPHYPCYVSMLYMILGVFFIFKNSELNKDLEYSLILPIKKSNIVKARCYSAALYEILFLIISIPFAFLNFKFIPNGNNAGIQPNFAFYGITLIIISICNLVFFSVFYKKAAKSDKAFFITLSIFILLYLVAELPIWLGRGGVVDTFKFMDSIKRKDLIKQLPILAAGIIIYFAGWILTYKISAKEFEKVDL